MNAKLPKILAIDDTPENLITLGTALEQDFDVQFATSGSSGLAFALAAPPDLILLDIMMPEMDGFETCQQIKEHAQLKNIPIVFVSAISEFQSESRGLALGAADYITKPISVDIARLRISNLLERERLRKEVETQRDQLQAEVIRRKQSEDRLAQSEAQLRTIIENEPECIKLVDVAGRLIQMNPAGLAMIEADSLDQVAGRPVVDLIAPEYKDAFIKMHQSVIAGNVAMMDFEVVGLQGGRRWLETHAVPMQDHGRTVQLAVTRDITDRKRMEDQIRQLAFHDTLTNLPNRRLLMDRPHIPHISERV